MRNFPVFKCGFFVIFTIALLAGLGLRTFWKYGDPAWVFWLGETMGAMLILFTGLSILVAITVRPQFVIELRSRKKRQGRVKLGERVFWYSISLAMILIGILFTIDFLDRLLENCLPPGC